MRRKIGVSTSILCQSRCSGCSGSELLYFEKKRNILEGRIQIQKSLSLDFFKILNIIRMQFKKTILWNKNPNQNHHNEPSQISPNIRQTALSIKTKCRLWLFRDLALLGLLTLLRIYKGIVIVLWGSWRSWSIAPLPILF